MAIRKQEIINSDQSSHFTCGQYIKLLKQHGIQISMDGKGRATDNAITKRFLRNLKWEKIYYEKYRIPREVSGQYEPILTNIIVIDRIKPLVTANRHNYTLGSLSQLNP